VPSDDIVETLVGITTFLCRSSCGASQLIEPVLSETADCSKWSLPACCSSSRNTTAMRVLELCSSSRCSRRAWSLGPISYGFPEPRQGKRTRSPPSMQEMEAPLRTLLCAGSTLIARDCYCVWAVVSFVLSLLLAFAQNLLILFDGARRQQARLLRGTRVRPGCADALLFLSLPLRHH
jgi:hypothetical protein